MTPTWQSECGRVQLWLGDCREILPLLPKVDAVVTDPPYGIFDHGGKWGKKFSLEWDRPDKKPNIDTLLEIGTAQIIWGGNYYELPPSRGWLVWHKRDRVVTAADCELAWTSLDMNTRLIDQTISATNSERCGHPTQKPIRVMIWTLSFIPDCELVLDSFMGSGTTGIACLRTGRRFIGIEIDPRYFQIAKERIERELAQGILCLPEPAPHKQTALI